VLYAHILQILCLLLAEITAKQETSINPEKWKKSFVTPIPKVNRPTQPQEARPINMLPPYEKGIRGSSTSATIYIPRRKQSFI
jgi:hypothetical protein